MVSVDKCHISGNKDLFFSITTTSVLPTVTLANGSQTVAKDIGLTHPLPSLPLTSVLYTPECSFNLIFINKITRSLNCSITFFNKFVTLQDRSTGKTIGIGRESQGLYHLASPHLQLLQFAFPLMLPSSSTVAWATLVYPSSRKWSLVFHLCRLLRDKLSAKATKCIFLGYSRLQKDYRCYSSKTHRYFLSADVTFFKNSPFFSTSESLLVSKVLPLPIIFPPDAVPFRPLQVYHRGHRVPVPPSLAEVPANSLPIPSTSPALALPHSADLSIALRKSNRSTRNPHPIYNFLSYHRLSSPYSAFVSVISSVSLLKSTPEALSHPGWRQAMVDEMTVLHSNDTCDLVVLPSGKSIVGCRWVYIVKIAYVRLLSMVAMRSWPLYQLDIKNVFLHGDLAEEVYMEQPPGFVTQGESGLEFGMFRSIADHSVFYHHNSSGQCIYLTKDLGKLKYFLGIEIAQSSSGVVLSQRKYALDILKESGMLNYKLVDTRMDPNVKLIPRQGEPLGDPGRYRRLVGKLNYLTITCPDIYFPVSVVSQFLQSPCDSHWDVVIHILRYIKNTPGQGVLYENRVHTQVVGYTDVDWAGSPTDRHSTSEYCVFIGGKLISWKSKKQDMPDLVLKPSIELWLWPHVNSYG
ncbi:Retrovirus-related Pol polyprotein from transposon RE2 [Vitis vinifera]|uniref:Retrovirus-related Pol polyprotein from transposon RE2 n=1 Tax=Vitis vinifera TaxID=29760 RepID=A0A438HC14_VITVI|nr:Retrovirus-related Pol polyprotein from transposon RE2 [Vitis vinifera]